MTDEPAIDRDKPPLEPDIRQLEAELDGMYQELATLPGMEADVAFSRIAVMGARAAGIRSRLSRNPSRRTLGFLSREIEPFIETLASQARLLERVNSMRRARGSR